MKSIKVAAIVAAIIVILFGSWQIIIDLVYEVQRESMESPANVEGK